MSDYFAELESHLLAAARGRRRRRVSSWRWAPVVAALAAAAAVAVALLPRPADDERPVGRPGVVVPLVSGERASPCAADPVAVREAAAPEELTAMLAVLRRARRDDDPLPPLGFIGGPHDTSQWLPVGTLDPAAVRLAAHGTGRTPVHVVPTTEVLSGPPACADRAPRSRGPGACLVAVDGPPLTRCFTVAEIRAGRAFMLATGSGTGARVVGLVPDGVAAVSVTTGGRTFELPVAANIVQRYVSADDLGRRARVVLR